jgi:hypothetical protein
LPEHRTKVGRGVSGGNEKRTPHRARLLQASICSALKYPAAKAGVGRKASESDSQLKTIADDNR